jgi:PAS domain S-box-containing protein
MDWLLPALFIALAGSLLITFTYLNLYLQERQKYLALWLTSWSLYSIRFVFETLVVLRGERDMLLVMNYLSLLWSAAFLLWGTCLFSGKKLHGGWPAVFAVGSIWIIAGIYFHCASLWTIIPTFLISAFANIFTGMVLLRFNKAGGLAKLTGGWAFIVWGLHKLDYPLLRPLAWSAPVGYAVGAVIGFVSAISVVLMHLEKTNKDLKASEERYRSIFENALEGIFQTTPEGRLVSANRSLAAMLGYESPEQLMGSVEDLATQVYVDADDRERLRTLVGEHGSVEQFETRVRRKDGEVRWVSVNGQAVKDEYGETRLYEGYLEDISDRKQTLAVLRESEERFQNAFKFAAIGMALVAPDGRWVKVNRSLCGLVGYSEEELLTKTFQDITHPDDLETDLEFVRQMLAKKIQTYQMEKRYIHKSGRIVWISLSVSLVRDGEDNPLYFISQIEDITDRKQVEENLKKSEERLSKFFMVAPIGIAVSRLPEGHLLDINNEFETMLGFGRSEAVGKTTTELGVWLDPKDRENLLTRVRTEGRVRDVDLRVRAKQGNIVSLRFSAVPIQIDGQSYLLSAFVDVTRQRKAEEELKRYQVHLEELVATRTSELSAANRKLKELDRLKSMFIASMSHELRTPLNSIIGFTGMTLQGMSGELNDEQKDNLTRAYHSAKHLLDLISDVIDISKIEAGRVEAYPEGFFLRKLVDDAVTTVVPQLRDKALTIEVDVPADTYVNTDRRRLLQCLINFLSNAVKFTESGRVIVASRKTDELVSLSVSDTGIGVAKEDLHRLFEPFERLESHLRVKAGGTGLGLYLTKKLAIDVLRGDVSVESIEGQGSTFTITFPGDIGQAGKPSTDRERGDIL